MKIGITKYELIIFNVESDIMLNNMRISAKMDLSFFFIFFLL